MIEEYKFQKLNVYRLALDYVIEIYDLAVRLPDIERFNLRSQIQRAATSIPLNIAEGSTGQTNLEQHRFLGLAVRSYLETIACLDLFERMEYLASDDTSVARKLGHKLFIKLGAFRRSLISK